MAAGQQVEWTRDELYDEDFTWTIIDGRVYAIGDFVPKHPGGPLIKRAIGEDASELFHTHHTGKRALAVLERLDIGGLRGAELRRGAGRPFQEALNRRAAGLERAPRWPVAELVAVAMLAVFACWAVAAYALGWWRLNVALAWFWWRHLDSGLHSAVHGDFRWRRGWHRCFLLIYGTLSSRAVEYYNGQAQLQGVGMSKHYWHHVHTNNRQQDPDWSTMTGIVWVRRHWSAQWHRCHRWQRVYWLPVTTIVEPFLELFHVAISLLEAFALLLEPPSEAAPPLPRRLGACAALCAELLLNPGFQGASFFLQPWRRALGTLLLARGVARIVLYPFSEVQHYMPELFDAPPAGRGSGRGVGVADGSGADGLGVEEEWAVGQLRRTANLRLGSPIARALDFFMFHGDTYQIEHHLWPAMSFVRLPQAASIVRATCAEFGVPYHEVGYLEGYAKIWQQVSANRYPPSQVDVDLACGEAGPAAAAGSGEEPEAPRAWVCSLKRHLEEDEPPDTPVEKPRAKRRPLSSTSSASE